MEVMVIRAQTIGVGSGATHSVVEVVVVQAVIVDPGVEEMSPNHTQIMQEDKQPTVSMGGLVVNHHLIPDYT